MEPSAKVIKYSNLIYTYMYLTYTLKNISVLLYILDIPTSLSLPPLPLSFI